VSIPYLLQINRDKPEFISCDKTNTIKFNYVGEEDYDESKWIEFEHNNPNTIKIYVEFIVNTFEKSIEINFHDCLDRIKPKRKNAYMYRYIWFVDLINKIDNNILHQLISPKEINCLFRFYYESNKQANLYNQFISANRDEYSKYKRVRTLMGIEWGFDLKIHNLKIKKFFGINQQELNYFIPYWKN